MDLFLKYGLNDNIIFKLYSFINEFLDKKFNIISDNAEIIKIIIINIITFIYVNDKKLNFYILSFIIFIKNLIF
jgi:hypothetical protein